jgi:hypothetical protein
MMNKVRTGLMSTNWIPNYVLEQLEAKWARPEWQKKSKKAMINKAADGRSVSAAELRKRFVSI